MDIIHQCVLTLISQGNIDVMVVTRTMAKTIQTQQLQPYKHEKHFIIQMNLQIHFVYICF
jgi:hypothetical protein